MAVFVCFATKAVHLELVKDLSTASFLNALKRFISTRGRPSQIWSGNATNFVGAKNEPLDLKRLFISRNHIDSVHKFCMDDSIDWKFIPPLSPHFGGLWEAALKTAKHHFYRAVGSCALNFEEPRTLVCHLASIINSRPLFPLSEDPADLDVLTLSHFLIGAPSSSFVEPDVTHFQINRLDGWQRVTYLQQQFLCHWREEYLTLLLQRSRWPTPKPGICVNDLVLVKDANLPPLSWPLARTTELIVGKDGVARVAILRTATGETRRAANKLCLLPIKDSVEGPSLPAGGECLATQPKQLEQHRLLIL
ncbi:uncharacterized protein LOC135432583 [Drosophila montana]|uniref:uncharacterized protein LOC135432583 n=1 Tax=Drosophila montana TaxID=40370 RepID=UPI00313A8833